jgi:hypothetical protein
VDQYSDSQFLTVHEWPLKDSCTAALTDEASGSNGPPHPSPSLAPHLHQRLPHDVDSIPRPIVGRDTALGMSKYLHGEVLRTARVAQLVLHAVPQRVHGDLLVRDDRAQPLHQHGGGFVIATGLSIGGKDGVGIR